MTKNLSKINSYCLSAMSDDIVMTETDAPNEKKEKKEKPIFEVKKWNAVALWSYNIKQENCTICHSNIMEPCIECQSKANNDDNNECKVAWGTCGVCLIFFLQLFFTLLLACLS